MNLQATSVDMSDSLRPDKIDIAESDHVQQKPLQPDVVDELETLAKWLVEGEKFDGLQEGSRQCVDPDLTTKLQPLLNKPGISDLVCSDFIHMTATNASADGTTLRIANFTV